jgi:hypothetical protein
MKKALLLIFVLISVVSRAQVSLPVYYTIPPTAAGCDGIVAIDSRSISSGGCSTAPFAYISDCNPSAPPAMVWAVDTLFLTNVCTFPCVFSITDANGFGCAICGIPGNSTGLDEKTQELSVVFNQQISRFEMKNFPVGKYSLSILDMTGRAVYQTELNIQKTDYAEQLHEMNKGIYLYSIVGEGVFKSGRAVIQ